MVTTSWMWAADNGGVNGASVDTEQLLIHWYDSVGCACGDSAAVQTFTQFREKGSPLGQLDTDIYQEMTATLTQLEYLRNKP